MDSYTVRNNGQTDYLSVSFWVLGIKLVVGKLGQKEATQIFAIRQNKKREFRRL